MKTAPSTLPVTKPDAAADTDTLSHWVKLAFKTMRHEMESALRASGLSVTQWRALGALLHGAGVTPSDLARTLEIEAPSVTSLVNGLERKGWVKHTRSSADARVKELSLTPTGRRVIEKAKDALAPIEARMAATLSPAEAKTLKRLLCTMVEGLH